MTKSPKHQFVFAKDFDWLVTPAIINEQYHIFTDKKQQPICYVSWANISPNIKNRFLTGKIRLSPFEWDSGDTTWIIDIVSPFEPAANYVKKLKEEKFEDKKLSMIGKSKDGKRFLEKTI